MYGVPEDLDLTLFSGVRLDTITFAQYTIYLSFDRSTAITIEASYAYDSGSNNVDHGRPIEHARLLELVGRSVESATRNGRLSLLLHFEGNRVLELFDDSAEYESFIITIGDTIIIV